MIERKPNWNKWKLIPNAMVWQVVALSLDIEPEKVKHNPQAWMANGYTTLEGQEFKDRVDILAANINRNDLLKPTALSANGGAYFSVNIANFANWGLSVGWELPLELTQIANTQKIEPVFPSVKQPEKSAGIKVLNARTENNYLRLILALANSIDAFNPKKPYEAAQLIINETEIDLCKQTIANYVSRAYELESKSRL